MDCPHLVKVSPEAPAPLHANRSTYYTPFYHIKWLTKNGIKRYRWKWIKDQPILLFRFEKEEDKILFALRWS